MAECSYPRTVASSIRWCFSKIYDHCDCQTFTTNQSAFWLSGISIRLFCRSFLRVMFLKNTEMKKRIFCALTLWRMFSQQFKPSHWALWNFYGSCFRTALSFGLPGCWCWTWVDARYSHTHIGLFDIAQTRQNEENSIGVPFKIQADVFWAPKAHRVCLSNRGAPVSQKVKRWPGPPAIIHSTWGSYSMAFHLDNSVFHSMEQLMLSFFVYNHLSDICL